MKTLFERLKDEPKDRLRNETSSYPYTYSQLHKELHAEVNVFSLSFGSVNDLARATKTQLINDVYELFEDQTHEEEI